MNILAREWKNAMKAGLSLTAIDGEGCWFGTAEQIREYERLNLEKEVTEF